MTDYYAVNETKKIYLYVDNGEIYSYMLLRATSWQRDKVTLYFDGVIEAGFTFDNNGDLIMYDGWKHYYNVDDVDKS